MLVVEVLEPKFGGGLADQLRRRAAVAAVPVTVMQAEAPTHVAGLVIALAGSNAAQNGAGQLDAIIGSDAHEIAEFWATRLEPFARWLTTGRTPNGPATLAFPDPTWVLTAARKLNRLRAALASLPGAEGFDYQHIGSTAVPDLKAKPIIDLQICVPTLPALEDFARLLQPVGFMPATGARPDSPGVFQDAQRGRQVVKPALLRKQLYVCPDPAAPAILHLRHRDSPFARHTVLLRDWLRTHPDERRRYHQLKTELAARHAGDADYDDYTRGKSGFIAELANKIDDIRRADA